MRARLLGHRLERVPGRHVVHEWFEADERAVGEGGDSRLQVQHQAHGYAQNLSTQRAEEVGELVEAGPVRPATEPDPDLAVVLEDVASIQGPRLLDPGDPVAETGKGLLGPGRLRPALDGTRSADHGQVVVHQHGVLDERRVRAVAGGRDLDDLPALGGQRRDIPLPLAEGETRVDGGPVEVGQQSVGQSGTRTTDQRA